MTISPMIHQVDSQTWNIGDIFQAIMVIGTTDEDNAMTVTFTIKFTQQIITTPSDSGNMCKKSGGGSSYSNSILLCNPLKVCIASRQCVAVVRKVYCARRGRVQGPLS